MAQNRDIPRCELCGSEYPNDPGAALACCSDRGEPIELDDVQEDDRIDELRTDGGIPRLRDLEEDEDPVQACPECQNTDIYLRGRQGIGGPDPLDDKKFRCNNCKHSFNHPEIRPDRRRSRSGGEPA